MVVANKSIRYGSMGCYIAKIQKVDIPLRILLNMDFLTDLMDKELEKREIVENDKN